MSTGRHARGALAVAALLAAAPACDLPARPAHPRLWTLADIEALFDSTAAGGGAPVATDDGLPGGITLDHVFADERFDLALGTTFTEGYRSAYVTTEIWSGFDQVWVQPLYIAVSGSSSDGTLNEIGQPIFSVGPPSAFYSPYWEIVFFDLPVGASPDDFKSARDVIDSGATLHPSRGRVISLVPDDVGDAVESFAMNSRGIGKPGRGNGWLDGRSVAYRDFGSGTFRWGTDRAIQETPLYVFVKRDPSTGALIPLPDLPTVGGSGPPYSGTLPARATDTTRRPLYGSFWRVYTVILPDAARAFIPQAYADKLGGVPDEVRGVISDSVNTAVTATPTAYEPWVGRVAKAPCFDTPDQIDPSNNLPNSCIYLDSQGAIEREVAGWAIQRTGVTITCPFVSYGDLPVPVVPKL